MIKNEQGGYIDLMPVENRLYYYSSYQNNVLSERYTKITQDGLKYRFSPVLYGSESNIFIHIYVITVCVVLTALVHRPKESMCVMVQVAS